jgi:riboflavin kinase/FMN adenylyltransferase
MRFSGVVEHGDHRGRALGFPTANLYFADESALPPDGVYGGFVRRADADRPLLGAAAISVGTNPTFGKHRRRLEAHILGFDDDIYGVPIDVEVAFHVRDMITFQSVDDLIDTMRNDAAQCAARAAQLAPFAD